MNLLIQALRKGHKSLNLFASFALLALAFASSLSAATIDDLKFTLINNDTEYSVAAKEPASIAGAVTIPATYNGKPVTEIAKYGFGVSASATDFPDITSVSIPSSIKVIRYNAFYLCDSLTTVTFATDSELTTIENYAFSYCRALTSINLPDSLTSIGYAAFSAATQLTEITIPASLTALPSSAFASCHNLASITFLGSAPTLGLSVFYYTGSSVGGFTITIYDTYEDSYAEWRDSYTFNVVSEPVLIHAQTRYNPSNKAFSIVTTDEGSAVTLVLQHKTTMADADWSTVSTTAITKATDADSGAVTRTVTLNPTANPTGFYRLVSEDSTN